MRKLSTILIWILAAIVAASLIVSIALVVCPQFGVVAVTSRWSLLPGVAISAGVLVAILTYTRDHGKLLKEQQRQRSLVFLERATNGFADAVRLLSDQNNSRTTWVRAARTLLRAIGFRAKIEDEDIKVAYDLEAERARNELYNALTVVDPKTNERLPLPPTFFYGLPNWKDYRTLDDAALAASSDISVYSPSIDALPPIPTLRPLSSHSVIAIYNFMEYPKNYEDPLSEVGDWDENWESSHGIDQGAKRYVTHTKQKIAIGGKLHDRKSGGKSGG